eukprot:TRINITY_DN76099_c0_g1_i1.p1 TRINITY_DN76099_c0_g1~~TRINITY_DN76099_c0_g1_i1.p1  ORF type:complete len:353 (-),score=36.55 TRINITY_DN76099_c0_g1_i1:34-1050(-)
MAPAFPIVLASLASVAFGGGGGSPLAPDAEAAVAATHHPTLAELRRRVNPWPHISVDTFAKTPLSFIVRGLLTSNEIHELRRVAIDAFESDQEIRSDTSSTVSLDKTPKWRNERALIQLNQRLAAIVGVAGDHMEDGYFTVYAEGHTTNSLHLDNHHNLFNPRRMASFVIFITGEQQGLKGGGTVFPFAEFPAQQDGILSGDVLNQWSTHIAKDATLRPPSGNPAFGRVCSVGVDPNQTLCNDAMAFADKACEMGLPHTVRPLSGDAVLFWSLDHLGAETISAMHGTCGVSEGQKLILAKFVREGAISREQVLAEESGLWKALGAWRRAGGYSRKMEL